MKIEGGWREKKKKKNRYRYKNPSETWCDPSSYNTFVFWKLPKATNEMNLLEFLMCAAILHRFYICFQVISTDAAKEQDWNVPWYSRQKRFAWVVKTSLSDFHVL